MIIWKSVTFGIDEQYFENSRMIHLRIALISNDYPQIKSLRINLHVTILNELKIQANQRKLCFHVFQCLIAIFKILSKIFFRFWLVNFENIIELQKIILILMYLFRKN